MKLWRFSSIFFSVVLDMPQRHSSDSRIFLKRLHKHFLRVFFLQRSETFFFGFASFDTVALVSGRGWLTSDFNQFGLCGLKYLQKGNFLID